MWPTVSLIWVGALDPGLDGKILQLQGRRIANHHAVVVTIETECLANDARRE